MFGHDTQIALSIEIVTILLTQLNIKSIVEKLARISCYHH